MKFGRPIALLCLIFSLIACAPESGRVIDKEYEPAHYEYSTEYDCILRDQDGYCIWEVPREVKTWVKDRWSIKITNGQDEGWTRIKEHEYNQLEIGSCWKVEVC